MTSPPAKPETQTEDWMQAEIDRLCKLPCACVSCGTCFGRGNTSFFHLGVEEMEPCEDCDGHGITDECDRCREITELEIDQSASRHQLHGHFGAGNE